MSAPIEWDLSTPFSPAKSIHLPRVNYVGTLACGEYYRDGWDQEWNCDRLPNHTGRHRADERLGRYPVAVWL